MKVTRTRKIAASPDAVWRLVSDPHNMPRWWPRVMRVEDVNGQGRRARWTAVLQTDTGSGVRADFRCTASTKNERFAWSQDLEGTAFERIFKAVALEIRLAAESGGTQVSLTTDEALRGLSRLGSPMMKSAARRRLDEAFDGIERALVGEPG